MIQQFIANGPLQDVVEIETVRWTLEDLRSHRDDLYAIADLLDIEMSTSIFNQHVWLYVTDAALLDARLRATGLQLPATVDVEEVLSGPTPASHLNGDLLGGLALFDPDLGRNVCTSGFAGVRPSSGTKGIFTAGHCGEEDDDLEYGHPLIPVFTVGLSNANSDAQFHRNGSGEPLKNLVWLGNNTWLGINSLMWRGNGNNDVGEARMFIGQFICKMGMVTGEDCGEIESKEYDPGGPNPYGDFNRNPVFVQVDGNGINIADRGDSGGPWFGANGPERSAAFGITSGIFLGGNGQERAFFTAIDWLYNAGYEVYVNCPNYTCG